MPKDAPAFYALSVEQTLDHWQVRPEQGLSDDQVRRRRQEHGPNRLRRARRRSVWKILVEQFKSVVLIILAVAAVLAFVMTQWAEGLAIVAVLLVNGAIGFFSEYKALRSLEALREMGRRTARVRRGGRERRIPIDQLVPGDVVLIEGGDIVPADLRVIECNNLRIKEAALTGESVPVSKQTAAVDRDAAVGDRASMLFKGATVSEGSGGGVVVATGMNTELGRIAAMAESAQQQATPLEQKIDRLGRRLAWITLTIAAVVAGAGLLAGQPTLLMIETAIALGVAAIPEGLPIVATLALARGMWIMARRQALINRLSAVETLGATRVILTDKTGTLTENRMAVRRLITPAGAYEVRLEDGRFDDADDPAVRQMLRLLVLCNNASLQAGQDGRDDELGDPMEAALLRAGRAAGLDRSELLDRWPEQREQPFDSQTKMMATFHRDGDSGQLLVAVKGAPQQVLAACDRIADDSGPSGRPLDDAQRRQWSQRAEQLADEGLRLLAVADRRVASADAPPYEHLRLLGLVALMDPPRAGVRQAIDACQRAGIRVVMVTGDHPGTARAIASQVGLLEGDAPRVMHGSEIGPAEQLDDAQRDRLTEVQVFARVSPKQKLDLVNAFQQAGQTVAMTGDGVNDAPALKKADIGVAMGLRGTDAARQVADMVLKDDSLGSIVAAVAQGRVIFGNIRKSVLFMLCTNVAEIIAVAVASLLRAPLPLLPLQILYLNVLTDVFPALALGLGKGSPRVMDRPPLAHGEPVMTRGHWWAVAGWGSVIAGCVLAALTVSLLWLGMDQPTAVTVSFLTLAFSKLWFTFTLRDPDTTLLDNDVVRNPWVWGAVALCVVLLIAAVYLPGLSHVLKTRPLGLVGWMVVGLLSLAPLTAGQIRRALQSGRTSL